MYIWGQYLEAETLTRIVTHTLITVRKNVERALNLTAFTLPILIPIGMMDFENFLSQVPCLAQLSLNVRLLVSLLQ